MTVPKQCQPIADSIAEMEQERSDLQAELQVAPTNRKAFLAAQIKALNRRIALTRNQLVDCLATFPQTPSPPPLDATFTGEATITTTNQSAQGPYSASIILGLVFTGARTFVSISSFPPIMTAPFQTPVGPNVTTVTKIGGGGGSYANGAILIPLTLRFDHSIDLPFYDEDSDLSLVLSTASGAPVAADGSVTLAGSGLLTGGFLGGSTCTVAISGTINPVP